MFVMVAFVGRTADLTVVEIPTCLAEIAYKTIFFLYTSTDKRIQKYKVPDLELHNYIPNLDTR